jgi:hypothetical protein
MHETGIYLLHLIAPSWFQFAVTPPRSRGRERAEILAEGV